MPRVGPRSCGPAIVLEDTSEPFPALDCAVCVGLFAQRFNQLVAPALVIALRVVVLRVFPHDFTKMALAQRDDLIETLGSDGENESAQGEFNAWSFRFRKKAGRQRRRSITNLSSGHIARCILHGITGQCEADSSSGSGLLSVVDRSRAAREYSMTPGRTDCENGQVCGGLAWVVQ